MMKNISFLIILNLALCSCGAKKQEQNDETQELQETAEVADGIREPTDDEIREYGLIKEIEDGAYPMFSITVEFPERQMSASFSFNVEASPLDVEQLMVMKDNYATIYYLSEEEADIVNVMVECDPIYGAMEMDGEGLKEVTGVLSGASALSGDLPGEVAVTADDGTVVNFKYFIDEEMIAVNGQEVTVFYYLAYRETITYLEASKD